MTKRPMRLCFCTFYARSVYFYASFKSVEEAQNHLDYIVLTLSPVVCDYNKTMIPLQALRNVFSGLFSELFRQ